MKNIINIKISKKIFILFSILSASIYCVYHILYPTMICRGSYSKLNKWTSDYNSADVKIIEDNKVDVSWSLLIRRDALYINEDRFPLFKELNYKNIHAEKTQFGYRGKYQTNMIQQWDYSFEYNNITNQLSASVSAAGFHILDGKGGKDKLKATFVGVCERKWF